MDIDSVMVDFYVLPLSGAKCIEMAWITHPTFFLFQMSVILRVSHGKLNVTRLFRAIFNRDKTTLSPSQATLLLYLC